MLIPSTTPVPTLGGDNQVQILVQVRSMYIQ